MRGITHFMMGITVATFFKSLVLGSAMYDSLIIVLGGVFGLMPDTLDFKLFIYFDKNDLVIDPNPHDLKPQEIANAIAAEINKAGGLNPGKMRKVRLHTLKLGPDLWQSYSLTFNTHKKQVEVRVGPHVTMSGIPAFGTQPPADKALGVASYTPNLIEKHGRPSELKGFSGPSFGFYKRKDGAVEVLFIPWHRNVSHSLTLGLLFTFLGWGLTSNWIVGAVIFLAWLMHIVLDTFGHMGNNLFWPITKRRTRGLHLVSASHPFWNAFVVYTCIAIVLWNLNIYNAEVSSTYTVPWIAGLGLISYLLLVVALPMGILGGAYYFYKSRGMGRKPVELFAPSEGAVGAMATEGMGFQEEEHYYEAGMVEKSTPPLWLRAFGMVILIGIFVVLFILGPGW